MNLLSALPLRPAALAGLACILFQLSAFAAPPTVTSVSPASGKQGQTVSLIIQGTNFLQFPTTVAVTGTGITVSGVQVVTSSTLFATFTIAANATVSNRDVTVTTADGTSSTVPFAVIAAAVPTVTAISIPNANVGQTLNITLTGTNFVPGATFVNAAGNGVGISNVNVSSPTSLTATLTIAGGTGIGGHNVSVTTAGGTSNAVGFSVLGAPTLTSVVSNFNFPGRVATVNVNGTNFTFGQTTVAISGTGITIDSVAPPPNNPIGAGLRVVTMTIASNAPLGARNLTVTTPGGTTAALPFYVVDGMGYTISTIVGQATIVEGGVATNQPLPGVSDIARDSLGNLYIASGGANKVFKVTPGGVISTFAGTGDASNAGDGLLAVNAQLTYPRAVAVDASNNVYIAEGNSIRKVATDGTISHFAGRGNQGNFGSPGPAGFGGDGGPAYNALLSTPTGLSFDAAGNLYVVDSGNVRIRKITPAGIISTVAGNGFFGFNGDDVPATSIGLAITSETGKVAFDSSGNLYFADSENNRIRMVTPGGLISTFAGTGTPGFSGDGAAANLAEIHFPTGVAIDANGNVYITDTANGRIRKIGTNNNISTIAGNGAFLFNGDGPDATVLQLSDPRNPVADAAGNVYFCDVESNRVRMVSTAGALSTVAGNTGVFSGDNGQAALARLYKPQGIAVDLGDNILIADTGLARIRRVSAANGVITTIAGNGSFTIAGNSGSATGTAIGYPFDVAAAPDGSVYVASTDVELGGNDSRIWKILPNQTISTVAGGSTSGYNGDGIAASAATLNMPYGITVDSAGNVYIADTGNNRVRRINASDGTIVTVVGTGVEGAGGDNGPATSAQLSNPTKLAFDTAGKLYIADSGNDRIRVVATNGTITTLVTGFGAAVAAGGGDVFFTGGQRVFTSRSGGPFELIAGASATYPGNSGADQSAAVMASLDVIGMAVTSGGAIVFADSGANVVRKLTPAPSGSPVLGVSPLGISSRGGGLITTSSTLLITLAPTNQVESYPWTATLNVATPMNGQWLSVTPLSGNGPTAMTVTTDNAGLDPGVYNGSITITAPSAPNSPIVVPVTLTVNPSTIATNPQSLSLSGAVGGFLSSTISVFTGGFGGDISVSTSATTITPNPGNWLSVSPTDITATSFTNPAILTVGIDTTNLAAGRYDGKITLTGAGASNSPVTIPVTLNLNTPAAPALTSITPINAGRLQTVTVTFTGSNFVSGATVNVSGTGVTVGAVTALSPTTLTAVLTIDPAATIGARTVSVTTPGGTTATQTFTIIAAPTLTSVSPGSGAIGQSVLVNLAGANFVQNATTINVSGTGVTVSSIVPTTSTTARTATLVIASNATPGVRTLTVSTPAGTTAGLNFSVTPSDGYLISTFAGLSVITEGGAATAQPLPPPNDVAMDSNGNYYLAIPNANKVFKVTPGGTITTFAGTGRFGTTGDGGPATQAQLNFPRAVVVDGNNNVIIADSNNNRVRRVATDGTITTIAGTGVNGFAGDLGPAIYAQFAVPSGLGIDPSGNIYVLDFNNRRIRKITPGGIVTTVAGSGVLGFFGDGLQATLAQFTFDASSPKLAIDAAGNIYIPDTGNHRIRKVATDGVISTIAGTGVFGAGGDGGPATSAQLNAPRGVILGAGGSLFIADSNSNKIRKIVNGTISTVAGNGNVGFNGDGPTATALQLSNPQGMALDASGNLYIADINARRLRKLTPAGALSTIAGSGGVFSGDNNPMNLATLYQPSAIAFAPNGDLVIADSRNYRIRKVDSGGTITTIAGTGVQGTSLDGTIATAAQIGFVTDLFIDSSGNIFFSASNQVRKINASDGKVNTVAGTGVSGFLGDNDVATAARMNGPNGLVVDSAGNIYIADTNNHRIRKVNASDGKINTIAGTGAAGALGDGGQATAAQLNGPRKISMDAAGNLYIADNNNNRTRKIATDQTISLFSLFGGRSVLADSGNVYVSSGSQLQRVASDGTTTLLAGLSFGIFGDGGPALLASMNAASLAVKSSTGEIFFADDQDDVVRLLSPNAQPVLSVSPAGVFLRFGSLGSTTSTLQVLLSGSGTATWTASTAIANGPAGSQWLTIPQGSGGTGAAPLVATINAFGLPLGSYNGTVTITSPDTINSTVAVPVTLTVLPALIASSVNSISATGTVGGANPANAPITINNGGSGANFVFNAGTQVLTPVGGTWLGLTAASGTTGVVTPSVTFNTAGLGSGVYTGYVVFTSGQAANSSVFVPVTLTMNPAAAPTLTAITPPSGNPGELVSVTFTGTNFFPAATQVNTSGGVITVGTVGVLSGTSLYTTFSIAPGAAPGNYAVNVSTANGVSTAVNFIVAGRRGRSQITSQ